MSYRDSVMQEVDSWLTLVLRNNTTILCHPGDSELIERAVLSHIRSQLTTSEQILKIRALEGGIINLPVQLIAWWCVETPEERTKLWEIRAYIDSLDPNEEI